VVVEWQAELQERVGVVPLDAQHLFVVQVFAQVENVDADQAHVGGLFQRGGLHDPLVLVDHDFEQEADLVRLVLLLFNGQVGQFLAAVWVGLRRMVGHEPLDCGRAVVVKGKVFFFAALAEDGGIPAGVVR